MPDCSNSFSFPVNMLPQAWGSRLVGCLFMRNTVNQDSLRRRLTLKHSREWKAEKLSLQAWKHKRESEGVCVSRLNSWRRDTTKGSGLTLMVCQGQGLVTTSLLHCRLIYKDLQLHPFPHLRFASAWLDSTSRVCALPGKIILYFI